MGEKSIFDLIRDWAEEKGIYKSGKIGKQYEKIVEEVGELGGALIENDDVEINDALGDIIIASTNLAKMKGLKIENCIIDAYNVIKSRKGKMIKGQFVKDKK